MKSEPTFFILSYFWLNEWWPYYQKDVNQVTLNHTTLFNLAVQILSNVNLFLNQTLLTFFYETNLDDSNDSGNFSLRGYLPLIQKDYS